MFYFMKNKYRRFLTNLAWKNEGSRNPIAWRQARLLAASRI